MPLTIIVSWSLKLVTYRKHVEVDLSHPTRTIAGEIKSGDGFVLRIFMVF